MAPTASQQMVGWCEAAAQRLISPGGETAVSLQSRLTAMTAASCGRQEVRSRCRLTRCEEDSFPLRRGRANQIPPPPGETVGSSSRPPIGGRGSTWWWAESNVPSGLCSSSTWKYCPVVD